MAIGSRKRRRDEPVVIPSAEDSQREAVLSRLFDGVLRSARSQLLRAESPLAAEVWGSGLMAVWDNLPANPGDDPGSSFAEALVRHAADLGTADGLAVRVATRARTAAAMLEQQGLTAPAWAGVAGMALPTEAWIGSDVYGDQEIVIIGFAYPNLVGDPGHSICVLVDHSEGGVAKDAYPAAPLAQTLARWREAEGDGIGLRPVSLAEVAARLADALLATDFSDRAPRTEGRALAEMRALLSSRLATLPPAANTGLEELDADGRDWLVAEFLGAPEAAGQGIASRLYDAVEAAAREQGIRSLFTEASELARRVFERKGSPYLWVAYYSHGREEREVARHVRTGEKLEATTEKNRHEAERWLKHRLGEIAAEKHGGRVVKMLGDGVLAVFPDGAQAIDAVVHLQRDHTKRKGIRKGTELMDLQIARRCY